MKIIKSSGEEVTFSKSNIIKAVQAANMRVSLDKRFSDDEIKDIAKNVEDKCKNEPHTLNTGDIQVMVEDEIMQHGKFDIAREYITYRYQKALNQRKNTTDDEVMSLLGNTNELLKQENANKNPTIISTQRDYMAGILSKDLSKRYLIPEDIWKAHKDKIIHFHDADYFAQKSTNCCLWNLEDMLQNGTVVSNVKIDKPHKFSTACNICTQIIAQVASSQYGGQTVNIAHLSPFVEESRKTFRKRYQGLNLPEDKFNELVEQMVERDIIDGVQILQYQISTLMTVNGQTPFVTLWMYLNDAKDEKDKEDLAKIIAEIIKQRKKGVKNKNGAYSAIPFPKLIYALEEDNINEDGKYYWLTKLAAECTADKMVPDYISEKMMLELKGMCYPSMGCVAGDSTVRIKLDGEEMTLTFKNVYDLLKNSHEETAQFVDGNPNKYIDTTNTELYVFDSNKSNFVKVNKIMKNIGTNIGWKQIILNDGHTLTCTENHIITTNKFDEIEVKNITDDKLYVSKNNEIVECCISSIQDISSHDEIDEKDEFEII